MAEVAMPRGGNTRSGGLSIIGYTAPYTAQMERRNGRIIVRVKAVTQSGQRNILLSSL